MVTGKEIRGWIVFLTIMIVVILFVCYVAYLLIFDDKEKQRFLREECPKHNLQIKYMENNEGRISFCYKIKEGILIKYSVGYLDGDLILREGGNS